MAQVIKLKESDWSVLFPAKDFRIADTVLEITPLSLSSLARVTRRLTQCIEKINALGLSLESLQTEVPKIVELVSILLTDSPDILTELSGLDVEDIKKLPLHIAVELFTVCVDVNLESQESLVKNFKGLGSKVAKFMSGATTVQ